MRRIPAEAGLVCRMELESVVEGCGCCGYPAKSSRPSTNAFLADAGRVAISGRCELLARAHERGGLPTVARASFAMCHQVGRATLRVDCLQAIPSRRETRAASGGEEAKSRLHIKSVIRAKTCKASTEYKVINNGN